MIGAFTFLVTASRKAFMSPSSSRSGFCRHTSRMCAPLFDLRATDLGCLFDLPLGDQSLELPLPITLVRSPTSTGRLSSLIS